MLPVLAEVSVLLDGTGDDHVLQVPHHLVQLLVEAGADLGIAEGLEAVLGADDVGRVEDNLPVAEEVFFDLANPWFHHRPVIGTIDDDPAQHENGVVLVDCLVQFLPKSYCRLVSVFGHRCPGRRK